MWVLGKKVWWCTNADDFPLLVSTSRDINITEVLRKIKLEGCWPYWTLFDKFCVIFISLAASAPFLNLSDPHNHPWFGIQNQEFLERFMRQLESKLQGNLTNEYLTTDDVTGPCFDSDEGSTFRAVSKDAGVTSFHGFGELTKRMQDEEDKDLKTPSRRHTMRAGVVSDGYSDDESTSEVDTPVPRRSYVTTAHHPLL